jgi:hypothetical protein
MNYSACWRSKNVLVSTSDGTLLILRQIGLQLSVPQSQGYLTLCKCWTVTFQPLSIDTHDYLCLFIVVHHQLLSFDYYLIRCFIVPIHCLIQECIPGISILLNINHHQSSQ